MVFFRANKQRAVFSASIMAISMVECGGNRVLGEEGGSVLMKVRDVIKLVEADGWRLVSIVGDHRQYKHSTKRGRVTIPGHPSDEMHPKTLASIFKQAQIPRKR